MILFEAKYHFKKAIFIGTIFLWNVFLFWVIWFTYSSDKMSTLDTIVKDYDKNIVLRDCQRQAFEYLHQKLSYDRSLHDDVFWDYFWDAYRDRASKDRQLCIGDRFRKERQLDWMRLDSALKKSSPIYLGPKNLDTFWCTGWAWNCQIIFRCASIHGRAGFILMVTFSLV
jgi:hypothetical protein